MNLIKDYFHNMFHKETHSAVKFNVEAEYLEAKRVAAKEFLGERLLIAQNSTFKWSRG